MAGSKAGNRPRVNNQPDAFPNTQTLSGLWPPLSSPGSPGGEKSQNPSTRLTSKLSPRKNKLRAARVPEEEAVMREPLPGPTLVNVFLILCRWRRLSLQISISLHCLPSLLLQRKQKERLSRLFFYHFTRLFKAITFLNLN